MSSEQLTQIVKPAAFRYLAAVGNAFAWTRWLDYETDADLLDAAIEGAGPIKYAYISTLSDQAKINALVEALRFYANPEIYKSHPHGPAFDRRDLSATAAAALALAGTP